MTAELCAEFFREVNKMILADKIIRLRKKNGWSQEELADKMNVSRQAVSKWESAQTIPDIGKILQLGELFGVTTDYLLKDEIENEEFTNSDISSGVKRVTMAEANEYIEHRKKASIIIALGVFLCIISPCALIILSGATEYFNLNIGVAVTIGIVALLLLVAAAVGMFIYCSFKNAAFSYLDRDFETEYGVSGMVKEKDKLFTPFGVISNLPVHNFPHPYPDFRIPRQRICRLRLRRRNSRNNRNCRYALHYRHREKPQYAPLAQGR